MSNVTIEIWVLIICIVVLLFSLISILILLLRKNNKNYYGYHSDHNRMNKKGFDNEISLQIILQHLDLLMVKTINEIEKQRHFIQEYMDKRTSINSYISEMPFFNENGIIQHIQNKEQVVKDIPENQDIERKDASMPSLSKSNYKAISDLFRSGMDTKQISRGLNIPQSEIDLYIKLHLSQNNTKKKPSSLFSLSA